MGERAGHNLRSASKAERRDGWRRLVLKHIAATSGVTVTGLARRLERTRQRLQAMLEEDGGASLKLDDVAVFLDELGEAWWVEANRILGYELRPVVATAGAGDVLTAIAAVLREVGEAVAIATPLAVGQVTPARREEVRREIAEARQALARLEAVLDAEETVIPIPASRR